MERGNVALSKYTFIDALYMLPGVIHRTSNQDAHEMGKQIIEYSMEREDKEQRVSSIYTLPLLTEDKLNQRMDLIPFNNELSKFHEFVGWAPDQSALYRKRCQLYSRLNDETLLTNPKSETIKNPTVEKLLLHFYKEIAIYLVCERRRIRQRKQLNDRLKNVVPYIRREERPPYEVQILENSPKTYPVTIVPGTKEDLDQQQEMLETYIRFFQQTPCMTEIDDKKNVMRPTFQSYFGKEDVKLMNDLAARIYSYMMQNKPGTKTPRWYFITIRTMLTKDIKQVLHNLFPVMFENVYTRTNTDDVSERESHRKAM